MKNVFSSLILMLTLTNLGLAQSTSCGQAVAQLQNYAAQVNQIYQYEYWTAIPNQRCPQVVWQCCNQWGQQYQMAVNPQVVQNCRWQMLSNLNQWYGQQSNYVNNSYVQIMQGCATNPKSTSSKPAPKQINTDDENSEIDTEQIEEMTAGIDEDKAIPIKIPKTASGFKPKQ